MCEASCHIEPERPVAIPERDRTFIVTEQCPHCGHEIEMCWDTDALGFQSFCPVCGQRLMLCDECRHADPPTPCDYNGEKDRCHRMPPEGGRHG